MKNQINQRLQTILLAAITTIFLLGAAHSTFAQAGSGAKYGTRDLTTCADTKNPAKGAITAALAAQYARCTYEKADRESIGLLEDLKIQVGGAIPFNPKTYPYASDVNPNAPVYPLRGSYRNYLCAPVSDDEQWGNRGANCTVFVNTKATGVCWKTTFGDWWCAITNGGGANDSNLTEYKMPPPGGAKTAAAAAAEPAKDKPVTAAKNNNQPNAPKAAVDENKDENGFPKPDFSEMEKFYEIVRYEYNNIDHTLNIVAKMTQQVNPNDFKITFYDADGAKLLSNGYVLWSNSDLNYQPGEVHKFNASLP
jgi:hypothetical protein